MPEVPLYCQVCKKQFSGIIPAKDHFLSRDHKKKEQYNAEFSMAYSGTNFTCRICNIPCNSKTTLEEHLLSNRHKAAEIRAFTTFQEQEPWPHIQENFSEQNRLVDQVPVLGCANNGPHTPKEYDFDGTRGFCHLCNIELNSHQHADQHLNGTKHRKAKSKVESPGASVGLHCDICGVNFSGKLNADQHFASEKHRKNAGAQPFLSNSSLGKHLEEPNWQTLTHSFVESSHSEQNNDKKDSVLNNGQYSPTPVGTPKPKQNMQYDVRPERDAYYFDGNTGKCFLCNIDLTSPQHAQQHLAGAKHKRAVDQKVAKQLIPVIHEKTKKDYDFVGTKGRCHICEIDLTSRSHADQHLSGSKHQKALLKKQSEVEASVVKEGKTASEEYVIYSDNKGYCNVCRLDLTSIQHAKQHLTGSKHLKAKLQWQPQQRDGSEVKNSEQGFVCSPVIIQPNLLPVRDELTNVQTPMELPPKNDREYTMQGTTGYCHMCSLDLTSKQHAIQHLNGKNHQKAKSRQMNVPLQQNFSQHTTSEKHKKKDVLMVSQFKEENDPYKYELCSDGPVSFTGTPAGNLEVFGCYTCGCNLNSREELAIHEETLQHKTTKERLGMCGLFNMNQNALGGFQPFDQVTSGDIGEQGSSIGPFAMDPYLSVGNEKEPKEMHNRGDFTNLLQKTQQLVGDFSEETFAKTSGPPLSITGVLTEQIKNQQDDTENYDVFGKITVDFDNSASAKSNQYDPMNQNHSLNFGVQQEPIAAERSGGNGDSFTNHMNQKNNEMVDYSVFRKENEHNFSKQNLHISNMAEDFKDIKKDNKLTEMELANKHNTSNQDFLNSVKYEKNTQAETSVPDRINVEVTTNYLPRPLKSMVDPTQDSVGPDNEASCKDGGGRRRGIGTDSARAMRNRTPKSRFSKNSLDSSVDRDSSDSEEEKASILEKEDLGEDDGENESFYTCDLASASLLSRSSMAGVNKQNVNTVHESASQISATAASFMKNIPPTNISQNSVSIANILSSLARGRGITRGENSSPFPFHKFLCSTCNVPCNTAKALADHQQGAKHQAKVATAPAPVRNHPPLKKYVENSYKAGTFNLTETEPRTYQCELLSKVMSNDKICFLPTGTGKTLVASMAVSAMVDLNPTRQVLFLVNKVLLVLQQSDYLKKEIGQCTYRRFDPEDPSKNLNRKLQIAALCGGQQSTGGMALWQHDVIILTAAFCENLLRKGILRWEDQCLVVFDEAHHCAKNHPYNQLLRNYHLKMKPEDQCKMLGLTASPSGMKTLPLTEDMLKQLQTNMSSHIAIVQLENQELKKYQSNAEICVSAAPSSGKEESLDTELRLYLLHCYMRLAAETDIIQQFDSGLELSSMKNNTSEQMRMYAFHLTDDIIQFIEGTIDQAKPYNNSSAKRIEMYNLSSHTKIICMSISVLIEGGIPAAIEELQELMATNLGNSFEFAKSIDLPVDNLLETIDMCMQIQKSEFSKTDPLHAGPAHPEYPTGIQRLVLELTSKKRIIWNSQRNSRESNTGQVVLVLVRQRATAYTLCRELQEHPAVQELGLNVIAVVGHGSSGSAEKGMNVAQQKRALEDIRDNQYQVIIATAVAEEGIDLPECELVISMNPPSTMTALVQMRGRARKKKSKFVIVCKDPKEEEKMKDLLMREKYMVEAANRLVKEK